MSKEVKRYGMCGFESGIVEMEDGPCVAWADYEAILAERDRMAAALKALRAATPSLTCESFHHERRDLHGHDEECPPFERWIAAALACNAALKGAQP